MLTKKKWGEGLFWGFWSADYPPLGFRTPNDRARGSMSTDAKIEAAAAESMVNRVSKPQRAWIHAMRGTEEAMTEKFTM